MKNIIISLSFIFCSVGAIAQPTTIRIDPANAQGGTVSQIFDEVNYIPLETTKESLFGDIGGLIVAKKYFIIRDYDTRSVLLFDKKGKFHTKITFKNLAIVDFKYQEDKKRILVYLIDEKAFTPEDEKKTEANSAEFNKVYKKSLSVRFYDLDGNQLTDLIPETYLIFSGMKSIRLSPTFTASTFSIADEHYPDSTAYQLNVYKNKQLYKSWFPYNTKKSIARCGSYVNFGRGNIVESQTDGAWYYNRPVDYSIYRLTPDTLIPVWKFIFPQQNTVPESVYNDTVSSQGELQKQLGANPSWIVNLEKIHLFNNLIVFRAYHVDYFSSRNFVYSFKSSSLIAMDRITPDSINSYLPFLPPYAFSDKFMAQENGYLYSKVSSLVMFKAKESTAAKNPVYPPVLEKYFKNENRKSNPVIVQLKPKKDL